jgi:hypothetical protein
MGGLRQGETGDQGMGEFTNRAPDPGDFYPNAFMVLVIVAMITKFTQGLTGWTGTSYVMGIERACRFH